jgi:DNA-binding MarR family transcriptional regulator
MGTAVKTFAQVEEAGEAFYGFFHRVDLPPLDDSEIRVLWRDVTGVDLSGDQAGAIRILTGGNPRLAAVLGRSTRHPDLTHLGEDLDLLVDEYTPYFKATIEVLPAAERKVLITLADVWSPATAAEVAERARMTSGMVSALLGRLVRRGAVVVVGSQSGKNRYELTERLYNLYHLLRRRDGEGRVRALVDVLTHLSRAAGRASEVLPRILRPGSGELLPREFRELQLLLAAPKDADPTRRS